MKNLTTILLLVGFSFFAFANDEPVVIKGIIKDKETKEFIPFAHVIVGNQVTISNINGEFAIPIEPSGEKIELKVSYLGYETYTKEIKDYYIYHEIFLSPSTTILDDVTVLSGPGIMNMVFNNFHLNYIMEPLHMEGYYREALTDTSGYCYVTEGIMDIYTPSNVDKYGIPWVHPQRSRKKIYKPVPEEDFLAGNASDMAHYSIWRFDSFLHEKHRDNYEFFYDGTTNIGIHNVFMVDFEPKNRRGNTRGRLYIDNITYAIMKIVYSPNTEKSKFWDRTSWTEEYELIDGSFQLVSASYEGLAQNGTKHYDAVLVVNDCEVKYDLPRVKLIGNDVAFFDEADNNTPSVTFWQGFNAIKLNDRVATQIKSQDYGF